MQKEAENIFPPKARVTAEQKSDHAVPRSLPIKRSSKDSGMGGPG